MVHTVDVRAGVVPRTEYGFDSLEKLFLGVVGEVFAELRLVFCLELVSEAFKVVRSKVNVVFDALFFLHFVDKLLEIFLTDLHNDVREHLDKSSVTVPSPAGVARLRGDGIYNRLVETEVQNGVHHAGHRSSCARTNGNEQGIFLIPELLAADFFHLVDVSHYFLLNTVVDFATVFIVLCTSFRRYREALGYGKTDFGHFRKVRALAAQKLAHTCVCFGEEIAILLCH